jgi:hypothetical protein
MDRILLEDHRKRAKDQEWLGGNDAKFNNNDKLTLIDRFHNSINNFND